MPKTWPIAAWPTLDQKLWTRAAEEDPLSHEGEGASSHWRASTRRFNRTGYGDWLGWLDARHGVDPEMSPAERVTVHRLGEYLAEMKAAGLADYTCINRLQSLSDTLRTVCPKPSTAFISKLARRLSGTARRLKDLNGRLRPAHEILRLGYQLMSLGASHSLPPLRSAIAFRDGLLIGLWACRLLRVANLSQVTVDQHLINTGSGHVLTFTAADMKQRRPWTCSWPDRLELALLDYLMVYRPMIAARGDGTSKVLWLSQFGGPMPPRSVAQIIEMRTRAAFGHTISSHLMRHIAATGLAEAYPDSSTDIMAVLGHSGPETSDKHYVLGRGAAATRVYQDFLADF